MANLWLYSCVFSFLWTSISVADSKNISKLPPYIHTCKRSDPKLNECFKKFFESFESKLASGIPELNIPQMDPFKKDKLSFKIPGNGKNKMECSNVVVHGLKNLKIQDISINLDNLQIKSTASLPFVNAEGMYDVDAHLMNMALKGKGHFTGNASDIIIHCTASCKLIEKDGEQVLHVENADGDVLWKKHHLKIDNLFPDKKANDAFNNMANGPAGQSMARSHMPVIKNVIISTMIHYLNEVVERFPYNVILEP